MNELISWFLRPTSPSLSFSVRIWISFDKTCDFIASCCELFSSIFWFEIRSLSSWISRFRNWISLWWVWLKFGCEYFALNDVKYINWKLLLSSDYVFNKNVQFLKHSPKKMLVEVFFENLFDFKLKWDDYGSESSWLQNRIMILNSGLSKHQI